MACSMYVKVTIQAKDEDFEALLKNLDLIGIPFDRCKNSIYIPYESFNTVEEEVLYPYQKRLGIQYKIV